MRVFSGDGYMAKFYNVISVMGGTMKIYIMVRFFVKKTVMTKFYRTKSCVVSDLEDVWGDPLEFSFTIVKPYRPEDDNTEE